MAEERKNSAEENKYALKIPIGRRNSSKSPTGSDTSEIILSGDETCSSSGFRSGQNSDLGKFKNNVYFKNLHFIETSKGPLILLC